MPNAGLVPASTDADSMKFLRGDGLWAIAGSLVEMDCTYKGTQTMFRYNYSTGSTLGTGTQYLIKPPSGYTFADIKVLFYTGYSTSVTTSSGKSSGSVSAFVIFDKDQLLSKSLYGTGLVIDNAGDPLNDNTYRIGNGFYTPYVLSGTTDFPTPSAAALGWMQYNKNNDTLGVLALEGTEYFKAYALTI